MRIGSRTLPTFLVVGTIGAVVGHLVMHVLAAVSGRSLLVTMAIGPIAVAVFFGSSLVRRRITGRESFVMQEQFALVLLVSAAVLYAAGLPVLEYLDFLTAGLAAFLVFGRIGCTLVGCCHGVPTSLGIVYPPECHGPDGPYPRRLPVQLISAACWVVLAILAATLSLSRAPGTAMAVVLILHGELRVGLEVLRGDSRRHVLGLSVGQIFALAGIAAGLILLRVGAGTTTGELVLFAVGAGLALLIAVKPHVWFSDAGNARPPEHAAMLLDELVVRSSDAVRTRSFGEVTIGARTTRAGLEVSLSSTRAPMARADAILWFEALLDHRFEPDEMVRSHRGVWIALARPPIGPARPK
ncbi:MAG: prolipoprotein diacylglyceryl transferase [Enhygromyxa sp.]